MAQRERVHPPNVAYHEEGATVRARRPHGALPVVRRMRVGKLAQEDIGDRMSRNHRGGRKSTKMTAAVLAHYGHECHLRLPGCTYVATTRDHVIPIEHGGEDTIENCLPACRNCNSKRQDRNLAGTGARIIVVCGPPAGGKTTWIKQQAALEDATIDMDQIARAFMPNPLDQTHIYPPHIKSMAVAARSAAIAKAQRLYTPCRVWMIKALPTARDLAEWRGNRWPIVVIDPGRAVVEQRLAERAPDTPAVVARWYDQHREHVLKAATKVNPDGAPAAASTPPALTPPEPLRALNPPRDPSPSSALAPSRPW